MKGQYQMATVVVLGLITTFNTAFAASAAGLAVRLNVKAELNKDRDSDKTEDNKSSSRTTTEILVYELEIQTSNTSKQEAIFDLEWYFIKRPLDGKGKKGDPLVCEKGKTSLALGGQKRVLHPVQSKPLINSESKTSKKSSGNKSSSSSGSSNNFSGDTFGGYVVLVRHEGKILAKYSNEKKFTTDEWLAKLDAPIREGSGRKAKSSNKRKKGKKKK